MKKTLLTALALAVPLAALVAPLAAQAQTTPRQRVLLDAGWRFQLGGAAAAADAPAPRGTVTRWRWLADDLGPTDAATFAAAGLDTSGTNWQNAGIGDDVFGGRIGYAWFRATLPDAPGPVHVMHFEGVDDNCDVFLNGQRLLHHEGYDSAFDVPLDAAWKAGGPNVMAVLVQNTAAGGGISQPATLGDGRAAAAAVAGAAAPPPTPAFALAGYSDRAWRVVHLPHDYVVQGVFNPRGDAGHGSLPVPPAQYRKTFTLPASDKGKSVWVDFDGVYRDSHVWLNGHYLGANPSGYMGFRFDIGKYANYGGSNTLAVTVDPHKPEGWWYEGGGIYRHVWLNVASPVHVAPWGVAVTTQMPEPGPSGLATAATVTVKTTVDYPAVFNGNGSFQLVSTVVDPAGRAVGSVAAPANLAVPSREVTQKVVITRPALWSIEKPQLYHLHTVIKQGPQVVDTQDTPFGVRTLRYDANKGFFLNGRHVEIKGTCNHQDFAGVGIGMPDSVLTWRVKQLKAMGSNAYRMSHNPPAPELLDACDKLGMLVMDENRHFGDTYNAKSSSTTPTADLSDLASLIRRDRNHPSIIMWSLCNEEFSTQGTPAGARIFSAMAAVVHRYDTSRPLSSAMNGGYGQGVSTIEDLMGVNYNLYAYDSYHQSHPAQPMYGSETASTVSTRGVYTMAPFTLPRDRVHYTGDPAAGYVDAYDTNAPGWANTAEAAWQPIADRPFLAGGFVWTGFDYKGEPTPFAWPCINSHFGILDECGFPKDNFYYYQSVWGDKPMVHLLPHWNWSGKEGRPVSVWAYSNAATVALTLNGKSLGTRPVPRNGHVEWTVPYFPGNLHARAFDAAGRFVAADTVETTGAPAALKLSTDRVALTADGEDVTMVRVSVVDARGRVVPTAANRVAFTVTGAGHVAGVGNGDPSDHDPDQARTRLAFNGLCLVLVGANDTPGALRLSATSPGLAPAALGLSAH